ncbi:MAG: RDD family protein [Acidobacteria bacterium]|nr:RDD family protein [Acidobacteriota bacterium]
MEKYQTFWRRLGALLIDTFIMVPIVVLDDWFRQAEFAPLFFYVWIPLSAFVPTIYRIAMHTSGGQTLGKMACGVRVLDVTEEPLKLNQAIRRELFQIVANIGGIYLGIAYFGVDPESDAFKAAFAPFFNLVGVLGLADIVTCLLIAKRRALHDLIAGTVVVRTKTNLIKS